MRPSPSLVGKKVVLLRLNDPYVKIPAGTVGTVRLVDAAGTVHVDWATGDSLGLCPDDGDRFGIIE